MNNSPVKTASSKSMLPIVRKSLEKARVALGQSQLRILLAVSGGVDSMVLAHFISSLPRSEKVTCVIAHFNHGLRPESIQEQEFVRAYAESINCDFISKKAPAYDEKTNLESWAREHRYAFLESARQSNSCDLIATAHHVKDQAETMIMRFLNGRIATSSSGIAEIDLRRFLLRPILHCPKELVDSYAEEMRVDFVVDPSNLGLDRTRNWIRHKLLPLLEAEMNESVCSTISYVAERLSDDEIYLSERASNIVADEKDVENVRYLREIPAGIRWRVLLALAHKQCGDETKEIGYLALRRLSEAISSLSTFEKKEIELGSSWKCEFHMKGVIKFFRVE